MKWLPQRFNDSFAVVLVLAILGMWYAAGYNETLMAATLPLVTLVVQYYFRKRTDHVD